MEEPPPKAIRGPFSKHLDASMTMFRPAPRAIARTGDDSPAQSLLRYVWRMSGLHQVWVCLLALAVASLSMAPLELQRRIINNAIEDRDVRLLVILGVGYLAVIVLQSGLKFGMRIYQSWLSESAVRYSREHLARMHKNRVGDDGDAEGQGRAVSVIASEIDKVGGFVGEGLSQPVVNLGMLLAIIGYMLVVEPLVAAFSILFLLPQAIIVPAIQVRLNRLIEKRLGLLRDLSDTIVDTRESGQDIQDIEESGLQSKLGRIYANRITFLVLKFAVKGIVNILNALAPLTVLLVGGYLAMQGETTLGVVVAFMSGFERLSDPMRELLAYYRVAAQANVQHRMIARWI